MKLKTVWIISVIVIIIVCLGLVVLSCYKYQYYDDLSDAAMRFLNDADSSSTPNIILDQAPSGQQQIPDGYFIIIQRSESIVLKKMYYQNKALMCIRQFGFNAKVVRSDVYGNGTLRVKLYHDDAGSVIFKQYFDEHGNLINSRSVFILFPRGGGLY